MCDRYLYDSVFYSDVLCSANASMTATEHYQQQCEAVTKARTRYQAMVGTGGEILASCSDDFTIFMWKPESGKQPLLRMTGHQQVINHIAFSPDGRFLASASFDKKIKIWLVLFFQSICL